MTLAMSYKETRSQIVDCQPTSQFRLSSPVFTGSGLGIPSPEARQQVAQRYFPTVQGRSLTAKHGQLWFGRSFRQPLPVHPSVHLQLTRTSRFLLPLNTILNTKPSRWNSERHYTSVATRLARNCPRDLFKIDLNPLGWI